MSHQINVVLNCLIKRGWDVAQFVTQKMRTWVGSLILHVKSVVMYTYNASTEDVNTGRSLGLNGPPA